MRRAIGLLTLTNLWFLYTTPFACSAEEGPPAQAAKSQKAKVIQSAGEQISRGRDVNGMLARGRVFNASPGSSEVIEKWVCIGELRPGREAARESALQVADKKLAEYLRSLRPETDWPQSRVRSFVMRMAVDDSNFTEQLESGNRERLMKEFGIPETLSAEELRPEFGDKQLFVSKVEIVLTKALKNELAYKLRLDEAKERQWSLAKVMLAALAVFATIGLYYRFDERTKGYYTNWLRVGALAALAGAGYGIVRLL
jgi:hypothetical protein